MNWESAWNILDYYVRERHLARWRRTLTRRWQALGAGLRRRQERPMEDPTPIPAPAALATVGRAVLTKFDGETISAISAAIAEELRKEVFEAAVQDARGQLEQEFSARRERVLDEAARFKAQAERDADHRIDAEVAAQVADQQRDWQDQLDTAKGRARDWRARAEAAEGLVVSLITQLTGGVDQRPVYLYSGGHGLRDLDKAAINAILARGGMMLKSKATVSERQVVVHLADGRLADHAVFWMGTAPKPDVRYEDDGDEAGVEPPPAPGAPLALPEPHNP